MTFNYELLEQSNLVIITPVKFAIHESKEDVNLNVFVNDVYVKNVFKRYKGPRVWWCRPKLCAQTAGRHYGHPLEK